MNENKTNLEKSMEQIFNLPEDSAPIADVSKRNLPADIPAPKQTYEENTLEKDFHHARENIRALTERGQDTLDELLQIASASENARMYEVAGQIMKNLIDANKDLLDLQKKVRDIRKVDDPKQSETQSNPQVPQNVTNAIFVGSTAELQQLVNKRKEIIIDAQETVPQN